MKRRDLGRWVTLNDATAALAAVSGTPRLDAELLLAHALDMTREQVLVLQPPPPPGFAGLVARRCSHEPVAYITGTRGFWSIDLDVTPDVLIPRPDSETLIEAAIAHFGGRGPRRVLDLGTGSGALLLAALVQWPQATGIGVDASEAALNVARRNAERIAPGRAELRLGDWGAGLNEAFDLVLCNPPYVEAGAELPRDVCDFEPHAALFAGGDGLDVYRVLIAQLPRLIARGGMAAVETGSTQSAAVTKLARSARLSAKICRDLAGHDRCLVMTNSAWRGG